MRVRAYAKINWSLRITGKRPDGFHELETLFQEISLHDELTFTPAASLSLTCDEPSIPVDDRNLVLRAAKLLGAPPVAIELRKRIRAGGGLGGGSSDAAATLVALNGMFGLQRDDLASLALTLGSDVPFFLAGGRAYATGRGEVLTPVPSGDPVPLLLLLPEERVLTGEAFAMVRRYSPPAGPEAAWVNDFEEPVFAKLPRLRELKARLLDAGATFAAMSGSGSTLFGAFSDAASRDAAVPAFADVRVEACETR
ncbi:MAG TPA: 4-(cytidine 5'-diphospho)-2-C-methyl-D-erythritol kinase [Thermoanaerobaculia bacterium]|jgi:4-diphosphocytidyl-2-C-methyl-D-erythritol kinase